MKPSAAVSEHRLLNRIKARLILLYLFAFLAFETAVIGGTYAILSQEIMGPMYQSIRDEWSQQQSEALVQLLHPPKESTAPDTSPETISTWVVSADGRIVKRDSLLTDTRVNLAPVVIRLSDISMQYNNVTWGVRTLGDTRVLVGVKPIFHNHLRIGTFISFRSLKFMRETMETLLHIDIEIGILGILLVIPITYWLSHRSLLPVRTALQRQRNFVNDAAHELRTPLSILHGTLEIAQLDEDIESVRQSVKESIVETDYITSLISDLSTLARMESGATELNVRPVDLSRVVRDTLTAVQPLADARDIEIENLATTEPVQLEADGQRLRQLLFILVDNALKYTERGGVVRVATETHRHDVELLVADTGIGIPKDDLPHIFDRFYRTSLAENHASGSGIGLAIAAWIVEAHHGRVLVDSKAGEGTTFRVLLPLVQHGASPWKKVLH